MTRCYFTNLENIVIGELLKAKQSVKIAVAWINFSVYRHVFLQLLQKSIKIKIIINDDAKNRKYQAIIDELNGYGATIKLNRYGGLMHHKFCVIDKALCLFGSFNWTINANERNIEDLNISENISLVNGYVLEFKALWELSASDIRLIRNPHKCPSCGEPIFNIMLIGDEGYYQTKIDIIQQCSCSQKMVFTGYFDISVYMGYTEILNEFWDDIIQAEQSGDTIMINKLLSMRDFSLSCYLASVRHNRMNIPLIHAVAVKTWVWLDKVDGYMCYKIIWKERGTEPYIEDEYPVEC